MFQLFVLVCVTFASVAARSQVSGESEWPNVWSSRVASAHR